MEALVNTVNCVGVMGRGIALQFKNRFPDNFQAYAAACKKELVRPGRMFVFATGTLPFPHYIVNFPTKRHWRGKSRMEDLESGLRDLAQVIRERKIASIAIPPLGSGLGGLDWNEVRRKIETALEQLPDVRVVVFEPAGAPHNDVMTHARTIPAMTAGRAALIGLMRRYLAGLLDPFVTLLEIHKLMYFLQQSGESLRLSYSQGRYGPYAENLRHVLSAIEGYYISGYADGGDRPDKQLELVPGAESEAEEFLRSHPETQERFNRVADLVNGFESSFGLELLATVHWVVKRKKARTLDEVIRYTYAWNPHKSQFSRRQIEIAAQVLMGKGWIEPLEQGNATT
ncbi:MAG: macro domain-containing protein [Desulfovibrio sp.]|nr:macro domain-containing protein [Desulfovibrio sp.]